MACKDFTVGGYVLKEFAELKNSVINTSSNGYGTELEEVIESINKQSLLDSEVLLKFFWKMFVGDALLGNFDRHNGNWGFLINRERDEVKIAPIYDCGSCLYPQLEDDVMEEYLRNQVEIDKRVFTFPNSALRYNENKINYYEFISSMENEDCNEAILEVVQHINLDEINKIIDSSPFISEIRKRFYKVIIKNRYEKILLPVYEKLLKTKGV